MRLYAHPFSSCSQKVLIALYENATPFDHRSLEDPAASAELAVLWPLKRFPIVVDRGRTILETTTIIEHLQIHHPGSVRLIPDGKARPIHCHTPRLDQFIRGTATLSGERGSLP